MVQYKIADILYQLLLMLDEQQYFFIVGKLSMIYVNVMHSCYSKTSLFPVLFQLHDTSISFSEKLGIFFFFFFKNMWNQL